MRTSFLSKAALPMLFLSASTLAGCTIPLKPPPEISYDDAEPAVQLADPPKPVEVVEVPKLLPLPGQLKPLPGTRPKPDPAIPAHVLKRPMPRHASSRPAVVTSMPCKSIRSRRARFIRSMPHRGR